MPSSVWRPPPRHPRRQRCSAARRAGSIGCEQRVTGADQVFEDEASAAIYDHFNRWSASDAFYLDLARQTGGRVLDLGCGTGMLACRIAAEGCDVVGVDPADGMLRVARTRPGTENVRWVKGSGQSLELPCRFDLIYMTGHAFQTLLSDEDVLATLGNVARHLARDGRFAFETRIQRRKHGATGRHSRRVRWSRHPSTGASRSSSMPWRISRLESSISPSMIAISTPAWSASAVAASASSARRIWPACWRRPDWRLWPGMATGTTARFCRPAPRSSS
ncbi:class I SAM-dependent methyltransferase [Vineibacter terrae]|uniref:Class I SAM-dependent methyltransferase n=1 Tax=Vineibacter terrae TaxID=2586908 RepID=A0A5C8P9A7_9HYPH|nr:class I SAM-dependent methyltransferase [Vineibacter terrae]